ARALKSFIEAPSIASAIIVGASIVDLGAIARGALKPTARGVESEARVLADMGLTKNTKKVSSDEGKAIPDALTHDMSVEVKDTKRVSATKQVRVSTDAASEAGQQSVLVTGTNTKVSAEAQRRYDVIIRRDDLGPIPK